MAPHVYGLVMDVVCSTNVYGLIIAMVCSIKCLWHGYGCGMFHRDYDLVVVFSTGGMFHQGWLARGVVAAAPSLVT